MNITKHTILPLLALMLTLFTACSDEEAVTMPGTDEPTTPGLYINLTVSGDKAVYPSAAKTRAGYTQNGEATDGYREGESDLDENKVYNVDFFLFNSDGTLKKHVQQSTTTTTGPESDTSNDGLTGNFYKSGMILLLAGNSWKDSNGNITGVVAGDMLYALVNVDWTKASITTATSITKLDDLKTLTCTDEGVYLKKQSNGTKPFLMDGSLTFTSDLISTFNANEVNPVTVDVKRAAAKIRVNIYKSNENQWAGYNATIGTITGSLSNYASVTRASCDGATLEMDKRGLLRVLHDSETGKITAYDIFAEDDEESTTTGSDTETGETGDTNSEETETEGETEGTGSSAPTDYVGSMLFYTFANEWEGESSAETWLELNIPYDNTTDGDTYTRPDNYYKIVFLPNDGKQLKRNTFYEVDIHVKNDGSPVSEEPETIDTKNWTIAEWNSEAVTVVKNPTVDYLILSDYILDVRDEDNATITFYSSNYVTVEVIDLYKEVTEGKVSLADIKNTEIAEFIPRYLGRTLSTEKIAVPGVYYVNKENRRIDIRNDKKAGNKIVSVTPYKAEAFAPVPSNEEVLISWPEDQTKEGPINIYSKVPQNVSKRYITLRVTMPKSDGSGNLVKYAVVEQYPLEYVIIQEGLYSYADGGSVYNRDNPGSLYDYTVALPSSTGYWENDKWYSVSVPDSILYGTFYDDTDVEGLSGHVGKSVAMKSKFFISNHTWEDAEGLHEGVIYQVDDSYKDENKSSGLDGTVALVPNTPANNNSMYEVTISATSTKYTLSYPAINTDNNNRTYAEESEANNNLLSPHFVLASQLGNNSATPYWESAQDLCKHYVEVSRDGKLYDNWRLPTLAELQIVKNYQQSEHVYDITMNKVLNADGDTNPFYWTAGKYWYVNTTGAGGGEKQPFTEFKYEDNADIWTLEFDFAGFNSNMDVTYFEIRSESQQIIRFQFDTEWSANVNVQNASGENIGNISCDSHNDGTRDQNIAVTIWHHVKLEADGKNIYCTVTANDGTVEINRTSVATTALHINHFKFYLAKQMSQWAIDNIRLVDDGITTFIDFEDQNTYTSGWTMGGATTTHYGERTLSDGTTTSHFLNMKHVYGNNASENYYYITTITPSFSETEYFHITGVNGLPQKVLLPYATDIAYYQDENADGVADTENYTDSEGNTKTRKIIVKPDANGVVNKRVLMTTYTAGESSVTQRKLLTNNGDSEDIGLADFPYKRRVRCVRDIKTSDTE